MIRSKNDLIYCLMKDGENFKSVRKFKFLSRLHKNPIDDQIIIWRYIYALRHVEYHLNNRGIYHLFMQKVWLILLRHYSYKTGFQIPPNTIEEGLTIWHWGYLIINEKTKIGKNCTLYPGIVIGHKEAGGPSPVIGNNVFIGSGAKIFGGLTIGDNVTIASNSVVTKNIPSNTVVGGVPSVIIK